MNGQIRGCPIQKTHVIVQPRNFDPIQKTHVKGGADQLWGGPELILGGDVECSRDLTDSSHSVISLISLTHLTHSTDSLVTEGNKFREIDKSAPQQNRIRVIDSVV